MGRLFEGSANKKRKERKKGKGTEKLGGLYPMWKVTTSKYRKSRLMEKKSTAVFELYYVKSRPRNCCDNYHCVVLGL